MIMDTADIQNRMNAMIQPMLDKGLKSPEAYLKINAHSQSDVVLTWVKPDADREWDRIYRHPGGDGLDEQLDKADAFIAELPSKDETRLRNFMGALGKVIDMGRDTGIEIEFLNPLTESMKKLSENALTYQKVAAE